MSKHIEVVFFQRKPLPIHKSIEFIFDDIRRRLRDRISGVKFEFSYYSRGIVDRIRIMWQAKQHQGDINHITGDVHFAAILLNKNKTILTIHDCGMLTASSGIKHQLLKYFWFTLPIKKCAYITVVSEATKSALLQYVRYPESNIYTIPVPVSEKFVFAPFVFNANRPVILQYCTTPNKNALRVVAALAQISCRLILVGKMDSILQEALDQSQIDYENFYDVSVDVLVALYQRSDIICFASTYEGFGMPIVEAQKVGRPVLIGDIASMPEVAGGGALAINPFDVVDIRKGILRLINEASLRQQLIAQGIENAKRFDGDTIAKQYLQLYCKLSNRLITNDVREDINVC